MVTQEKTPVIFPFQGTFGAEKFKKIKILTFRFFDDNFFFLKKCNLTSKTHLSSKKWSPQEKTPVIFPFQGTFGAENFKK